MAREKKPYDLPCWMDLVNKGQWFTVCDQNWVPLFNWHAWHAGKDESGERKT